MYGALSSLPYLWELEEEQRGGVRGGGSVLKPLFEVASHNRGDIGADNVLK